MKFIENIDKNEYEQFVLNHPTKSHFMQSYYWGEVKSKTLKPYYVGLKDSNNNLIATALLLEKKLISKYTYLYCPRGFVCDYSNFELVKTFTRYLKQFRKTKNAIFIKIDPDIKLQDLDSDGNIIEDNNNFELVNFLKKIGYKHTGFIKNFENVEPRYTFRLKLTDMEIIDKNLHSTVRGIITKGNFHNLKIYKGDKSDIPLFYETMRETSIREKLIIPPLSYYQRFYETLNKHNMSDIYVIKVDIKELKNTYKNLIANLEEELKNLNIDKYTKKEKYYIKRDKLKVQIKKYSDNLEEIQNMKDEEIVLSSIITTKYKDKVWTVHGGNHNLLRNLNANYWLYYTIIRDAYKDGYKIVDFFGTTGNPDENNPIYGIHLFKKRFGGEYIEFIGEFDLVLNKFIYWVYNKPYSKLRKTFKKIKKKLIKKVK